MLFIQAHFEALVNLFIAVIGLLMASGWIKNARLKQVVTEAVNFAEQVKKTSNKPPDTTKLKSMALDYVQDRLPNVDVARVDEQIEAALGAINALKVPTVCPSPTITVTPEVTIVPVETAVLATEVK